MLKLYFKEKVEMLIRVSPRSLNLYKCVYQVGFIQRLEFRFWLLKGDQRPSGMGFCCFRSRLQLIESCGFKSLQKQHVSFT